MNFNEMSMKEQKYLLRQLSAPDINSSGVENLIKIIKSSDDSGVKADAVPIIIPLRPEGVELNKCYREVAKKVGSHGGRMILGWQIANALCFTADFHAVWESPDNELLDITPKGIKNMDVIVPIDEILFIPASNAVLGNKDRASLYFNSLENPLIDDLFACKKIMINLMNNAELEDDTLKVTLSRKDTDSYLDASEAVCMLNQMMKNGAKSYDAPCLCNSGVKYKDCHKRDLDKFINEMQG